MFKRSSGVLAHVTSLPSPHGVGTMGKTARDFVDFLGGRRTRPTGRCFRSVIPASAIRRTSAFRQRQAIRI